MQKLDVKKRKFAFVLLIMVITLVSVSLYYWFENKYYVYTDDARVDGDIIKVSPQITGRILELAVKEGQYLKADDYIGRQSDVNLASGSNLDLSFIKAPVNGTVIKKTAHVGEIGAPTAPVVMMADLNQLYITANVEEDKLHRVKEGQLVEYTIDSVPKVKFQGYVISVGDAANSVFSILPQSTGNSFVKITQRIPVKISIDDYHNQCLLPGMNAIVKIHVR